MHARAKDDEGMRLILATLERPGPAAPRVRALQALLEYPPSKMAPAMPLIEKSLAAADEAEKIAACVALIAAGDVAVAEGALPLYEAKRLQTATRLDGSPAFDPLALARLVFMGPAKAPSPARSALLLEALPRADAKMRAVLLDGLGADDAALLVTAAGILDPHKDFTTLEQIFLHLKAAADPRVADALARYADGATHPHFRTEAAFRLAELGDLRAAPHLAWRLQQDPTKLYDASDPHTAMMARDDRERVTSARLLAELAVTHPEARTQLREMAEQPTLGWMHSHPTPHANALRLLVALGSPEAPPTLRKLADPSEPVPARGAGAFPEAFAISQSALRYLGAARDPSGWAILEKQLGRRPAAFDSSMDALEQGGAATTGMTYRALAVGAAQGFSEWGDAKALPVLAKYAEDPKNNESARLEACTAAGWLAQGKARSDIVARVRASGAAHKRQFVLDCWLTGLGARPGPKEDAPLAALLVPRALPETRHEVARLLGAGGLDAEGRAKMVELLKDKTLVHDAALALLFGGDADSLAKVFAAYGAEPAEDQPPPPPIEPLRQLYAHSVPVITLEAYESGELARIASLAVAARAATVHGARQEWVLQALAYQLRMTGELDSGPHSLTRNVLRARLVAAAKGSDARKRDEALLLLWVLGERGVLGALAGEGGEVGEGAKARLGEASP
ncbi:MAG TPA: hypothetical protein VLM85_28350 [Polyangiaceae bacterium]|nr:hypothetical protein [Polyangiaceae bacterium]